MNNSVMKCCICNNEKIGQFITIDNEKYHLECIKSLKENTNKALKKIDNMFNEGNDDTIIDDLLELERMLEGNDYNE